MRDGLGRFAEILNLAARQENDWPNSPAPLGHSLSR